MIVKQRENPTRGHFEIYSSNGGLFFQPFSLVRSRSNWSL